MKSNSKNDNDEKKSSVLVVNCNRTNSINTSLANGELNLTFAATPSQHSNFLLNGYESGNFQNSNDFTKIDFSSDLQIKTNPMSNV